MSKIPKSFENGLNFNAHKLVFILDQSINRILKTSSTRITNSQYLLLKALAIHNNLSQDELCSMLNLTPGAISKAIDKVSKMQMIKVKIDKTDRRKRIVSLTLKGKKIFGDAFYLTTQRISSKLKSVPKAEYSKFIATMNKVTQLLAQD